MTFQLVDGLSPVFGPVPNISTLSFMISSSKIKIETEEEAFPFESLVADCGGVLGLFIGFNFLMIWTAVFELFIKFRKWIESNK